MFPCEAHVPGGVVGRTSYAAVFVELPDQMFGKPRPHFLVEVRVLLADDRIHQRFSPGYGAKSAGRFSVRLAVPSAKSG
jgi:hypothetical protein